MNLQDEIRKINNSNLSLEEKSKQIQTLYIKQSKINESSDQTNINECSHYNNNCLLYCNICMDYFGCRLCHDSVITTHNFDRYNVDKIKCKLCNIEQDVSNKCIKCNTIFGIYYCKICNLYENKILRYIIVINVIYVVKVKRKILNIVKNVMDVFL